MRYLATIFLTLIVWIFPFTVAFGNSFSNPPTWVQNVPDGGVFNDPVSGWPWNLDSSTGYLFTSVVADHEYVYTSRAWYGPWSGIGGGTIQQWDAPTGMLVSSISTNGLSGAYDIKLKDTGTGNIWVYVYMVDGVEIFDRSLNFIGYSFTPDPSTPTSSTDPAVDQKRMVTRNDGVSVLLKHYYGILGTYSSPGTGQNGQQNNLGLYQNNTSWTLTPQYTDNTWLTNTVPAPTTITNPYFGVESIALSPAGDYLYVAGGNKNGGISSRLEKIELDMPPSPTASISSNPPEAVSGGYITLSWTGNYTDYCDITSSSGVWGDTGLPPIEYKVGIGPITTNTTFTITCTRNSDGLTSTNSVLVPLQPPTAIISIPSGNEAVSPTDAVNFDGTSSHDASGGSVSTYEWREGNCSTGTLLSSAGIFSQSFALGSHSVYLRVRDVDNIWSTNCPLRVITVPPQCNDGIDNDGDGYIDFSGGDPGCVDANDNDESNCGNGICEQSYGESPKTCKLDCKIIFNSF